MTRFQPELSCRPLRSGITTGTCAALAARAATVFLLTGSAPRNACIVSPNGTRVTAEVLNATMRGASALCAIQKDAGDDPDITGGMHVYAEVKRAAEPGVHIDGGEGIGRVTKKGLDQPVGAAAINSVPRQMIANAVLEVCREHGHGGGIEVVVSIPGGAAMAAKTFNPRLGIENGLSILGTTGIVEPMSSRALVDTIAVEMNVARAEGWEKIIVTPGNYGEQFLAAHPELESAPTIKIANFIGDALDSAARLGFKQVLLVGHLGKLVKLAGNIFNTHSQYADCRLELLALHAALAGAESAFLSDLLQSVTVEDGWDKLRAAGCDEQVIASLEAAIENNMQRRVAGAVQTGAILFTNRHGLLACSHNARALLKEWNGD